MKKVVNRIIIYFIILEVLSVIVFLGSDFLLNKANHNYSSEAIYVWGDSQIYRGLDIERLKKISDKSVYSSAQEGSGVYDFYTFTKYVPDSSQVIIGFSKTLLVRDFKKDYNLSGLSLKALKTMKEKGYSWGNVLYILKNNIQPYKYFHTKTALLPNADTSIVFEEISIFEKQFSDFEERAPIKEAVFLEGIRNLIKKGNKIIILELPYHQKFLQAVAQSDVDDFLTRFSIVLNNELAISNIFNEVVSPQKNILSDYTHLNARGSELITDSFFETFLKDGQLKNKHIVYSIND